jgi:hypothetical protein
MGFDVGCFKLDSFERNYGDDLWEGEEMGVYGVVGFVDFLFRVHLLNFFIYETFVKRMWPS